MIDWTRVEELRAEVGEDAFDEVLDLFLEEVDEVMNRLREAPDSDCLPADLHFVRGSALNLGLKEFCTICQGLEHRLARGEPVDLGALLDCYGESKSLLIGSAKAGTKVA
ncbi:Hpt domain-containing protein [Rhodovulum euryhalinum]|uniref:HPt (Histidine-containing phosphotransfer) domain-containing protein n=1 Tax=Rhodovulum euryhalinum TaxID=35805 RepID=A0A4R2KR73_9RHOB|nr:Hpt domain-containing protein [Rhodovulum euryhalinum]TCO73449.1 HPt (histidine-containing phosphotransfer) domain-containing protein [Rhodovulum euryhalinum]